MPLAVPDIRLIAVDMDGTLLDGNGRIPGALWPLLEQVGTPSVASLELVARTTGYPIERIARWAHARAGLNVTWYLDDADEPPDLAQAAIALERLRFWRSLSGL